MNTVNIKDIDLNNSFFHFTSKSNLERIEKEGLKARIGGASKLKNENEARVYMSKGGKGILGIKNSFIHEMKGLRICDIPEEYREYFDITDFSSTEHVSKRAVYGAMEKKFRDEVYLVIDAVRRANKDLDSLVKFMKERMLESAIDATEEQVKTSEINEQATMIKSNQRQKEEISLEMSLKQE